MGVMFTILDPRLWLAVLLAGLPEDLQALLQ